MLPYNWGQEDPKDIHLGGILFMDHGWGLILIYNQVSSGATYTIHSKEQIELETEGLEVTLHIYHADNGIYNGK